MNSYDLFIRMKLKFHTSLEKYFVLFSAPASQAVWKIYKHIELKIFSIKSFRRGKKRKQIKRKSQNAGNLMSFWWKNSIMNISY